MTKGMMAMPAEYYGRFPNRRAPRVAAAEARHVPRSISDRTHVPFTPSLPPAPDTQPASAHTHALPPSR
eukprot:1976937-Pleurochrysis_carterae.AAC.1